MSTFLLFFVGFLVLSEVAAISFGDTWIERLLGSCVPNCIDRQPDDYCPKELPCVRPVRQTQCDNYRGKKVPCVRAVKRCTGDDYCPKSLPRINCLPRPDCEGQLDFPARQPGR